MSFNNHDVVLNISTYAFDTIGIEQIDANDMDRIRITRDCKYIVEQIICIICVILTFQYAYCYINLIGMWVKHVWDTIHGMYKTVLKDWFKGTGSGSGASTMFEGWDNEKHYGGWVMILHNI